MSKAGIEPPTSGQMAAVVPVEVHVQLKLSCTCLKFMLLSLETCHQVISWAHVACPCSAGAG